MGEDYGVCSICIFHTHEMIRYFLAYTAVAVWESYVRFIEPAVDSCSAGLKGHDLFVSGGGAKNPVLMRCVCVCVCVCMCVCVCVCVRERERVSTEVGIIIIF